MIKRGRDLELQSILMKIQLGCKLLEVVREPPRKYERSRGIGKLQCEKLPPNSDLVKITRESPKGMRPGMKAATETILMNF